MKYYVLCIISWLCLCAAAEGVAENMIVSGAGTRAANGAYINMGTHPTLSDGVNYYQNDDNLYLFRAAHSGMRLWVIANMLGSLNPDMNYYRVENSGDTPHAVTFNIVNHLGNAPGPDVQSDVAADPSALAMTVAGAGSEAANGVYAVMGVVDGVYYYKMGNIYLSRVTSGGLHFWILGKKYGDTLADDNYYGGQNSNATPAGLTMIYDYAQGDRPCPTVNDFSLPVALLSFSAVDHGGAIHLHWVTASETDNLGFVLERAVGCVETLHATSLQWDVIASYETHPELAGQGNSSARHEYSFVDATVEPGQSYGYRLSDVSTAGEVHIYDVIELAIPEAPEETVLEPPFPNPFNPETKIAYQLAECGLVKIIVYDLLGRRVHALVDEVQSTGSYTVYWQGNNRLGERVATGTYLIVLKTAEAVSKRKVIMMR